ncbi:unnamed protein product [Trichobilharzia szidati]|nr:unnamed protein product [Trichobilharzia szidati]
MSFSGSLLGEQSENVSLNKNISQFDELNDDISTSSFNDGVISVTSNDLNILIGCIRILLKTKPNSDPLLKLVDRLPSQVPGATIGVKQSFDNTLKASDSDVNTISAVLVDISENNVAKTIAREISRSNNKAPSSLSPQRQRSHSLNRLFSMKHKSVSHAEEIHTLNNNVAVTVAPVAAATVTTTPTTSGQSSIHRRKDMRSNNSENSEIVYLFDLNSTYHDNSSHNDHDSLLRDAAMNRKWRFVVNANKNDHDHEKLNNSVVEATCSYNGDSVPINHNYSNVIIKSQLNGISPGDCSFEGACAGGSGSVISGTDESMSRSSCEHHHHSIDESHTTAKVTASSEQHSVFESPCPALVNTTGGLNNDSHSKNDFSQDHFLTSQRSSDETTSQNSDPSGCTSLASSANAFGRQHLETATSVSESLHNKNLDGIQLNQGFSHFTSASGPSINSSSHISSSSPPTSPKQDFCDSLSGNINDRTTQYVASSSMSRGIEKRTRFSISVLPSNSEVREFGNATFTPNRSFLMQSKVPQTRYSNSEPTASSSVVRCSSVDLSQSDLINRLDRSSNETTSKCDPVEKSHLGFVSEIPVSSTLKHNNKKTAVQLRCSSLTSLCGTTSNTSLPIHRLHRHSRKLGASTSNQDIEGPGTSSFSVDSASNDSDSDSGLIGAATSQHSTASSSCHFNASFLHSFQSSSHDTADVREVDEQSSLLTCSSCGVHLGEDVIPDPIPENSESQDGTHDIGSDQIGTQVDEQSSYPRDEEDALSDLPLSSANISGRVTPLSLTSTTSRGGQLTHSSFHGTENNYRTSGMYSQSGLILPTGTTLPANVAHLARCGVGGVGGGGGGSGPVDFPSTLFQRHCTPDVTEKFNKFDLPPPRLTENETRSTVSDTWSTDVLPSDTEYADLGQEFSGSQANLTPEIMSRRLSNRTSPRVSHRHTHRHHHRRTAPVSESLTPETTDSSSLRPLPDVSSESNGGEMQQHLPSESPLEGMTVNEEGESGTDNAEVNNSGHLEGDAVNSKRNHQCQDNFESLQPTDSNSTEKKTSFSQPSPNPVDFSAATDYHPTPSTSHAKIPPVQTDKDKFRTLQPTDGRRSVNANRFHGSAHNLKESFSRLMERLDIMTKRQRISTNPSFEKQNGISGACHYNDCQSNLYTLLPDLMESVTMASGIYGQNQSSVIMSSPALLRNCKTVSNTTNKQGTTGANNSSQPSDDNIIKKEETVDEMMERYRRQTFNINTTSNSISNPTYNEYYNSIPSTSKSRLPKKNKHKIEDTEDIRNKNIPSKALLSSAPSSSPSSNSSASSSSSSSSSCASFSSSTGVHTHRSIPQLFNLALHGLQEIFSNSALSIIALNTIRKIKFTWNLIREQPLSQEVNMTGIFHENQILISLLNSILAGLYVTQQNSTVVDVLIETRNIILELSNRLDIHKNSDHNSLHSNVVKSNAVSAGVVVNGYSSENEFNNREDRNDWQFTTANDQTTSCSLIQCLISSLRQYLRQRQVYRAHLIKSRERLNQLKSNLELSVNWLQQGIRLQEEYILCRNLSELINQHKDLFTEFHQEFTSETSYCDPKARVEMVRKLVIQLLDKMKMKWRESSFNNNIITNSNGIISSATSLLNQYDGFMLSNNIWCSNPRNHDNNNHNNSHSVENIFIHLERLVMDEIYSYVIWMNDSTVEEERDDLFHRELAFLQNTITLTELRIPEHYHVVLPLQSVQNELRLLDCYHTPFDKFRCLKRVMNHILAALQLAHPTSIPCADDLLPVLIYLIIQANPPRLLSNIEFVNNFGGDSLENGEIQYIWCQFCSAVAEIRHLMSIRPMNNNNNKSS